MFRNQLASILDKERIVTTLAKAKELRPVVEKMITLGRDDTVHKRRQAAKSIHDKKLLSKLFEDISPRFSDRPGGYTRIIKLGPRRGDGAEMAILEFIDFDFEAGGAAAATVETTPTEPDTEEAADSDEETVETAAEKEEAKPKKKAASKKKAPAKKKAAKKKASDEKKDAPKKAASKKKAPAKKKASKKKAADESGEEE